MTINLLTNNANKTVASAIKNPSYQLLKGRQIEYHSSFFHSTLSKIFTVALMIFTMQMSRTHSMPLYPFECQTSSEVCTALDINMPQITKIRFEKYVAGFPRSENWIVATQRKETFSCKITPPHLKEFKTCEENGKYLRTLVLNTPAYRDQVFSSETPPQGFTMSVDGSYVNLNVNPLIRKNYEKALKIAENKILDPNFINLDPQAIEKILKTMNEVLLEGFPIEGGVYRKDLAFIQPEDQAGNIIPFVQKKYGKKGLKIFNSAFNKIASTKSLETLTPKEKKLWDVIFYTSPPPEKIPGLMETFIKAYHQKLHNPDINPIDFAAWIHMQIVNIHPFEDGNGRLARILMNAALKKGGKKSVVVLDDKKYTQAIKEEQRDKKPKAFANYLRTLCQMNLPFSSIKKFPGPI